MKTTALLLLSLSSLSVLLLLATVPLSVYAAATTAADVDDAYDAAAASVDDNNNDVEDQVPNNFILTNETSLLDVLDPAIVNDPDIISDIQYNLQNGNLIVLKDAFLPEFANLVWNEMDSIDDDDWKPFKTIRKNGHNFFKHRISTNRRKGTMNEIRNVFKHVKSREFMTMISGRNCMSEKHFSAL